MPLTVYDNFGSTQSSNQLYGVSLGVNNDRRAEVGQGAFWTATNPQENTYLATSGAGPCVIILIHMANGTGALGHLDGASEGWQVTAGIAQMVHELNYPDIDTILFSAGQAAQSKGGQKVLEIAVVAGAEKAYPGARVLWPQQPAGNTFGACVYQPTQARVALFDYMPGMWVGAGSATRGLRGYGFRGAKATLRHAPGWTPQSDQ